MYTELIDHFGQHDTTLRVSRRTGVAWDDESLHSAAYERDPAGYALLALTPGVLAAQRMRVLLRVLDSSWAGHDAEVRATLDRVTRVLAAALPGAAVATVLLALRRRRANHKHVTRATVRLLTAHPQSDALVRSHRAVLVDCLEHALGKATARGRARRLAATDPLADRLRQLYAGAALVAGEGSPFDIDAAAERPGTVTATNRGDIAATLVHLYRGGAAADLREALNRYVATVAARLPAYTGTLALVLDRSASMRGYGDREWAVLSQAEALRLVLAERCERLVVVNVGADAADPDGAAVKRPRFATGPDGATDLATGLLDAVTYRPDAIAIVSDGYENVYPGDLARVVATLPRIGVSTPVVFCTTAFGHSDDLSTRRPAPSLPHRAFWHEADLAPLVLWLVAHARGAASAGWLRAALLANLTHLESTMEVTR